MCFGGWREVVFDLRKTSAWGSDKKRSKEAFMYWHSRSKGGGGEAAARLVFFSPADIVRILLQACVIQTCSAIFKQTLLQQVELARKTNNP